MLVTESFPDSILQTLLELTCHLVWRLHDHKQEDGFVSIDSGTSSTDTEGVGEVLVEGGCFDNRVNVRGAETDALRVQNAVTISLVSNLHSTNEQLKREEGEVYLLP